MLRLPTPVLLATLCVCLWHPSCLGQETPTLEQEFRALQARHAAQTEAVAESMAQLYVARLRSLERQAATQGHYEAAQAYQAMSANNEAKPLTLIFYPEEADTSHGLELTFQQSERVLSNWTSQASARWDSLTLPQGGYAVRIVYSGKSSAAIPATLRESTYHVTADLPPAKGERREASLGNLRLAEDTNTLTLTLGDGVATSSITIHQVILVSHAS